MKMIKAAIATNLFWMFGFCASPVFAQTTWTACTGPNPGAICLPAAGYVGIGTTYPRNALEVASIEGNYVTSVRIGGQKQGNVAATTGTEASRNQILFSGWRDILTDTVGAKIVGVNNVAYNGTNASNLVQNTDLAFFTLRGGQWPSNADSTTESMRLTASGNLGIGTSNPQYPLSVNGTIAAKEVIVTATGWADYVFDTGYRLKPLEEVAEYVAANHHLPEMPSAKEVVEKGVNVAEMQAKLLAKIEELTLHLIAEQKENARLGAQNRDIVERLLRMEKKGVEK